MNIYDNVLRYGLLGYLEGTDRQSNGDTWFVDGNSGNAANTADSGQGASWDRPFSNINYAISRCSNNAGDVILVAANHTETIADTNDDNVSGTVTDELCVDKSGVTIIGMGTGTRRPTITLATATDAAIDVRAANCTLYNLIFYNTIADNVAMIDVQAGADGLIIENCRFYDSANTSEPILQIKLAANADDVTIRGNRFYNTAGSDGALAAIKCVGATIRLKIVDNIFRGDWNEQMIDADAAAGFDVEIIDNVMNNLDTGVGCLVDLHSGTTGIVKDNVGHAVVGTATAAIIADACLISGNLVTQNEGQDTEPALGGVGGTRVGNQWYVDSGTGADTGDGKSWDTAKATIDAAIALCTASNGDVINVAPGHGENVAAAGITCDVIGITILGHGHGESRPLITFITNASAALTVTADNVRLENLRFGCNITVQNHMIDVDGDDCQIVDCEFIENGQTGLSAVTADTTGGAGHGNNLLIQGCRFYFPTAGNMDNAIDIGCDINEVRILNNYIMGDFDEAGIEIPVAGNACQDMQILDNIVINEQAGVHCIEVEVTALTVTGVCARNTLICDTRASALQPNILSCHDNVWVALGGNFQPVKIEAQDVTPGNNIYVDSALGVDDTAHGTTWNEPVATINYAVTLCAGSNGDVIHVAPGHNEQLGDAQIDLGVVGITVLGYGNGRDMPTIDFDHSGSSINIGANNVTVKNINLQPSITVTAIGVDIESGVVGTVLDNVNMLVGEAGNGTDDLILGVNLKSGCHETIIKNCTFFSHASNDGNTHAIKFSGASDRCRIENNVFQGDWSTAIIGGDTAGSSDLVIRNNILYQTTTEPAIENHAGTTGIIVRNYIKTNVATVAVSIVSTGMFCFENWYNEDASGGAAAIEFASAVSVTATADD